MGRPKKRKYQPKPKTTRISGYFNNHEAALVRFVATDLLKVSETQFIKGAALEMAKATLQLAQERVDAESTSGSGDTTGQAAGATQDDVMGGAEESTT